MQEFIAKHQDKIAGTLSGFDRLVFRGHLRSIGHPRGMMTYLWFNQILLKDFGDHVADVTERLKEASLAEAKAYEHPVKYLNSGQADKETIAREILESACSSITTRSILSSASSMLAFKPGSLSPSRSASTDENGWHDRWKPLVSITCSMTTASRGLPTGPKLSA